MTKLVSNSPASFVTREHFALLIGRMEKPESGIRNRNLNWDPVKLGSTENRGSYHFTEKSGWGVESKMVSDLAVYRGNTTSVTGWIQKKGEIVLCESGIEKEVRNWLMVSNIPFGSYQPEWTDYLKTYSSESADAVLPADSSINSRHNNFTFSHVPGADPGFFSGGGALISCSTSTSINHIVFFLQNTSCIRKPQVISGGGGGCAPLATSP